MELRGARWKRVSRVYNSRGSFDLICIWVLRPFILEYYGCASFFLPQRPLPPQKPPPPFLELWRLWEYMHWVHHAVSARSFTQDKKKRRKKMDAVVLLLRILLLFPSAFPAWYFNLQNSEIMHQCGGIHCAGLDFMCRSASVYISHRHFCDMHAFQISAVSCRYWSHSWEMVQNRFLRCAYLGVLC